jgi:hypothetical protein
MTDKPIVADQEESQDLSSPVEPVKADAAEKHDNSDDPIPRKYVTEIVKRERKEAYNKAKREIMQEMQAQQEQVQQPQQAAQQPAPAQSGLGGMPQPSPEQIQKMIAEAVQKAEEKRQQEEMNKNLSAKAYEVAQKFNSHMANGKTKYPDFDEKVKDLDYASMSNIVHLATETGMPEDIMYDLAENPQKITHLMILAHSQPQLAKREMDKLAASIRANEAAKKQALPKEPLSQIQPSTVGTDSGQMSVRDFQKAFSSGNY